MNNKHHELVEEWINYIIDSKSTDIIDMLEKEIGTPELRVILVKILSWLKSRSRSGVTWKPLSLDKKYDWVCNLKLMMRCNSEICDLFMVNDQGLDFHTSISPEEKASLLSFVYDQYNMAPLPTWPPSGEDKK